MEQRKLGKFSVSAIGLGCMNLSGGYQAPTPLNQAERLLLGALDMGVTHFDTANQYGFGKNEELLGNVLSGHRQRFTLASKCGMGPDETGKREITNDPAKLQAHLEGSLRRLKTDVIDIYYLHRWDLRTPIEETIGLMSDWVRQGKIRGIGLSEASAATIRAAHAVHPIAAVQSEYSLWTRNPEIAVLETCRELGISFVAFSPLARGYLTGKLLDPTVFGEGDIRQNMPRFSAENYPKNLSLLEDYREIAAELGCTPAELAIAWVLSRGEHVLPITGTVELAHLAESLRGMDVAIPSHLHARLDGLFAHQAAFGARYSAGNQREVDTEEFPDSAK